MVIPKTKNQVGLGRSLINKRANDNRQTRDSDRHAAEPHESSTNLQSVTQEHDLDEFLNTAHLAARDFTAEKQNVRIIHTPTIGSKGDVNPFLLSTEEEKEAFRRHWELRSHLRVPRRPPWDRTMARSQLEQQERKSFLDWRRQLAVLQESEGLIMTPFERNLEVWRQLWRVVERSHLVVQIVDARNPLRFRCRDLELYVAELDGPFQEELRDGKGKRESLLLINKSDLLNEAQRLHWANYFDAEGIKYAFFSAAEARFHGGGDSCSDELDEGTSSSTGENAKETTSTIGPVNSQIYGDSQPSIQEIDFETAGIRACFGREENPDARIKILSVSELENLFIKSAPNLPGFNNPEKSPTKIVVGLVGYPNVGKSSTINALLGETKVSVSSTPGKTKHFQTINLPSGITLCDCPGLVFPQFAASAAELICDGVLPIDQMREYTGPIALVKRRIPKEILEQTYGLTIAEPLTRGEARMGDELLVAYAIGRGFTRSGVGTPDEARAARYILKDYINAKLLFSHPPPDTDPEAFNTQSREIALHHLVEAKKKKAPTTRIRQSAQTFEGPLNDQGTSTGSPRYAKNSSTNPLEEEGAPVSSIGPFVQTPQGPRLEYMRTKSYPHQNVMSDSATYSGPINRPEQSKIDTSNKKRHHKKLGKKEHKDW